MSREIKDSSLKVVVTLPNAGNTTSNGAIDLGATTPFPITEQIQARVSISAATGANNKNINIRLMESAEAAANFTNIALLANPILRSTDADGAGHSASNVTVQLQPNLKRYLKVVCLGEANGGDSSDGTATLQLLF